jgi:3'-5' exoribonuclease
MSGNPLTPVLTHAYARFNKNICSYSGKEQEMERAAVPSLDASSPALAFRDLTPGMRLAGHARIVQAEIAHTRTGSSFHRMTLGDQQGGELTAIRFEVGEEPAPVAGSIVRITGVIERYLGRASGKLTTCVADPNVPGELFLPRMPASRAASLTDLDALIVELMDPSLRVWVDVCFDPATRARFALHPAAVRHHGALVGGLLSHTVRVSRIALALADLAGEMVDREVLLAGALLHDLGKLTEVLPEPGAGFTEQGSLLGHVLLGALRAAQVAATIPALEAARVDLVLHAIVAAHGTREHGAPIVPATLEALLLHLADQAEAKLEAALEAIAQMPSMETWTTYHRDFGTRLRRSGS